MLEIGTTAAVVEIIHACLCVFPPQWCYKNLKASPFLFCCVSSAEDSQVTIQGFYSQEIVCVKLFYMGLTIDNLSTAMLQSLDLMVIVSNLEDLQKY